MKKGGLLSILVVALTVCGARAEAQQATKIPRLGMLVSGTFSSNESQINAFRQGLRELGYSEGRNIVIEYRYAEGKTDRFPDLASELIRLKVDVIITASTPSVLAAKRASNTIPIVFASVYDPVASGLVASLARPGGNATGLTSFSRELGGKRLELIKETFPKVTRVAYFWNRDSSGIGSVGLSDMQAVARDLGLQLQSLEVQSSNDFDRLVETTQRDRAEAITSAPGPILIHQKRIVDFATKKRLPAVYPSTQYVQVGGLMSYAPNFTDNWRRAAVYVDKILKGAKPADIPVEQPTKFELIINLNAAKQIGLTIPPNVLVRADRVIK